MNTRNSKENYQAVKTHDRRHIYCFAHVRTETPVRTLPDIITGEIRDTVVIGDEYPRFDSDSERQEFINSFDASTYKPKQLTKRGLNDIEKITGKTVAVSAKSVKRSQVSTTKIRKDIP